MANELTDWEQEEKAALLSMYDEGDYEALCNAYCHEGFQAHRYPDDQWVGGVCSVEVQGATRDEVAQKTAECICAKVRLDILGC